MTRAVAMSVLAASLVVDGARIAKRRQDPGITIVNGTDAEACVWKWQVGLANSGGSSFFCGGTLISPSWVVTAKHCVSGSSYDVLAGSLRFGQGERRSARRVVKKPDTDMALIELSEPFTLDNCINVPALPTREVPDGTRCWITGWGRIVNGGSQPTTLQQAETTVVSNSQCNSQMGGVNTTSVCVLGDYNGNPTSACNGDSGGPLVCEVDGAMTLFGATSWGYSCRGITVYDGVYSAMDWIESVAFAAPTPAPPPGTWVVTGSGCTETNSCVQSKNFGTGNYGNNEACTIQLGGSVSITVQAFSTERGYDILTMGGRSYSGTSGPSSGSYTGVISWASDYSVTGSGWKLCRS